MPTKNAAELAARLDRLPMTRHIWVLVTLISLGGAFELYDLFLTAYIAPGLVKANFFAPEFLGPFSVLAPYARSAALARARAASPSKQSRTRMLRRPVAGKCWRVDR